MTRAAAPPPPVHPAEAVEAGASIVRIATQRLREGLSRRIVGIDDAIEQVLICLFTRSHALLEGVPGLAKTLLLTSVSQLLDLTFSRIQFTPDLMPGDVTGAEYLAQDATTGQREFRFAKGPIFANVVLADEINRAPPKTQAALVEAMEERQVTSLGVTRPLDAPFFVLATQNPIEQQGTYPLPAAQLDRFLAKVCIGYPSFDEEARIVRLTVLPEERLAPIASRDDLLRIQDGIARGEVPPALVRYAVDLAQATRPAASRVPGVSEWVEWGVGPRAAQALVTGARARAWMRGRLRPDVDDVVAMAPSVFRHRLILSYAAEADGIGADDVVARVLENVPAPDGTARRAPRPRWWKRWLDAFLGPR